MNGWYSRLRVFFLMFALSLAAVRYFESFENREAEILLNLPEAKSGTVMSVTPINKAQMPDINFSSPAVNFYLMSDVPRSDEAPISRGKKKSK